MNPVFNPGDKVDLEILRETDLGFVAEINGVKDQEGLLYYNEIFEFLEPGRRLTGYIKEVRPEGGIDLMLQPFGNFGSDDLGKEILKVLKEQNGFIPVNAKSPAEEIYKIFRVSRNKFKMALGGLYKKRLVKFTDTGTELVSKP